MLSVRSVCTYLCCLCVVCAPVYAEHDQHVGGEDEAPGPHHHQNLAHEVAGVPLNTQHYHSDYITANMYLLTSMVARQMVSMGRVTKQVMASAMVRWYTR